MAEGVVGLLLERLSDLLVSEVELRTGVRRAFIEIKDELESTRAFLKDADAWKDNDRARSFVGRIRDAAYSVEDVLDDFTLGLAQLRDGSGKKSIGPSCLCKPTFSIAYLINRRRIASALRDLKIKIHNINQSNPRYHSFANKEIGWSSGAFGNGWRDPTGADALVIPREDEVVGIDEPKRCLTKWLVQGELELSVLSLVGMGGVGKTALLRKLYHSSTVKHYFERHAWVTLSASISRDDILRNLVQQLFEGIPEGVSDMEEPKLMSQLKSELINKRYVIVLDDLWNASTWKSIEKAFPDGRCGSRIILTTQQYIPNCDQYSLQTLSLEDSWTLFCRKTFKSVVGHRCPSHLEEVSRKIVNRCRGLPLTVLVIAGVLSSIPKKSTEWSILLRILDWQLEQDPLIHDSQTILSISYSYLPYRLKSCFLYFSVFSDNYPIKCSTLIRLWVAEGFVEKRYGVSTEKIAEHYLAELINRSLIEVGDRDLDGKVRTCRVHDVIREFIISKSQEENFNVLYREHEKWPEGRIRRLSIILTGKEFNPKPISLPSFRSLLMFGMIQNSTSSLLSLISRLPFLRVLDLENTSLQSFPKEIINLLHLRYLSLKNSRISSIPESLGKLKSLQTLDLRHCDGIKELPLEICKLQELENLLVYACSDEISITKKGVNLPTGTGSITTLTNISSFDAKEGSKVVKELGNLTNLRKLVITNLRKDDGRFLCDSIEQMKRLQTLKISAIASEELVMPLLYSPPTLLQKLYMQGVLEKLPNWILNLTNLVKFMLQGSKLKEDPLKGLQALPNLVELVLWDAYDGEELCFKGQWFQRLKRLDLIGLAQLRLVSVEEGSMPYVQKITVEDSEKLEIVPLGIESLAYLMEIRFINVPLRISEHERLQRVPLSIVDKSRKIGRE